jgi:predicted phosphoribosyltransferase
VSRVFRDRREAGVLLADAVAEVIGEEDCLVLGLPRGGVPVAEEVARGLGVPLDVLVVRKLGVPWQPELAFGAVSTGDVVVLNDDVVSGTGLEAGEIEAIVARERRELARREKLFLGGRAPLPVEGRTVILVDDVVCMSTPAGFIAVGAWYRDFGQVADGEVREILARANA